LRGCCRSTVCTRRSAFGLLAGRESLAPQEGSFSSEAKNVSAAAAAGGEQQDERREDERERSILTRVGFLAWSARAGSSR